MPLKNGGAGASGLEADELRIGSIAAVLPFAASLAVAFPVAPSGIRGLQSPDAVCCGSH
ncbi:hypothetical protein [Paenibacillus tyrfis]|uniref:hypothetical protein n=1 Tax=Paenibacillus tyrfis TaxID=1501230 RepID=UPI0020A08CEE|nr:hypothetical protein [Paenibacillus tyrfis]MCP1308141.1 hypothetical protein [Paenibacillus tyrfis]